MAVSMAEAFLPKTDDMFQAYDVVKQMHPNLLRYAPDNLRNPEIWREEAAATANFFSASVGFLANRLGDPILEKMATTTWWNVNRRQATTLLVDRVYDRALSMGVPPGLFSYPFVSDNDVQVYFVKEPETYPAGEAQILIPPEFLAQAIEKPIQALAITAWVCSQIQDMANDRLQTDLEYFPLRAEAIKAHFLNMALKRHPGLDLSERYREIVRKYPYGLESLHQAFKYWQHWE